MTVVQMIPLEGIPEAGPGSEVGALVAGAAPAIADEDIVVIAHKVVSKAEGRVRDLAEVSAGEHAQALARELDKDPRLVQLILDQTDEIVRAERGVLIVRTHAGLVCANAGVDASNVPGEDRVALLPEDPDASARRIRRELEAACGARPAVVVTDSFGRPWRLGQADVAIGCAGLRAVDDWRGRPDREGRELTATAVAVADQVASAADLCRDKAAGVPAVLIRGLGRHVIAEDGPGAAAIRRPAAEDLF